MLSIDEYNIVVDGVPLVNSWRKSTSRIFEGRDPSGTSKGALIEFVIEADNEAELSDRWEITKRELNRKASIVYGYRKTETEREFSFTLDDGETLSIVCSVRDVEEAQNTRLSRYCVLEVLCDTKPEPGPGNGPLSFDKPDIKEMSAALEKAEVYEGGNTLTVTCSGKFNALPMTPGIGPLNITSITEDIATGYAKIKTASPISGPPANAYVTVSGTVRYNGMWEALNFPAADEVVVRKDYEATEGAAGTILVGQWKTGKDLFNENLQEILEYMGVGTNNLTLIHRRLEDVGDGSAEFMLGAAEQAFVPGGIGDGHTQLVSAIAVKSVNYSRPDGGEMDTALSGVGGGPLPAAATIEGQVILNRQSPTFSTNMNLCWSLIEADVFDHLESVLGYAVTPYKVDLSFDSTTPAIAFSMYTMQNFSTTLSLERVTKRDIPHDAFVFPRGDSLHGIQFANALPIEVITREINRIGKTRADLSSIAPPSAPGFYFHLQSEHEEEAGPRHFNELGSDFFIQKRVEVWLKLKLV